MWKFKLKPQSHFSFSLSPSPSPSPYLSFSLQKFQWHFPSPSYPQSLLSSSSSSFSPFIWRSISTLSSSSSSLSSSSSFSPSPILSPSPLRDPRMLDLVLIRHGESEGNIAYNKSWLGDHSLYSGAFMKRHSSLWRLTDRGKEQAKMAGEWISKNLVTHHSSHFFDRYYVSEYIRAMETAALLSLPHSNWFVEVQLRERDWGLFDILSQKERIVKFSEETRRRDRDSLFYSPPGGESLVHVLARVDGLLTSFNRQCGDKKCLIVTHGEVMWAFRLRFERLSQLEYREMESNASAKEKIHNAQILHYSRRNPQTGEISPIFRWKRSVCPWDLSKSKNIWEEIIRPVHSNDSLLIHVNKVKRIYASDVMGQMGQQGQREQNANTNTQIQIQQQQQQQQQHGNHNKDQSSTTSSSSSSVSSSSPSAFPTLSPSMCPPSPVLPTPSLSTSPSPSPSPSLQPRHDEFSSFVISRVLNPFQMVHPRVLILTKTPRYEIEKKILGLKGNELHSELSRMGFIYDRLVQSYVRHQEGLNQLVVTLQQYGCKVTVVPIDECQNDHFEGTDLVISAGGDGSNLKSAAMMGIPTSGNVMGSGSGSGSGNQNQNCTVTPMRTKTHSDQHDHDHQHATETSSTQSTMNSSSTSPSPSLYPPTSSSPSSSKSPPISSSSPSPSFSSLSLSSSPSSFVSPSWRPIPLLGVNTDPQHSAGVLCAFSIESPHTAERVIEHFRKGHFVWSVKSRLRVTLIDRLGVRSVIPQYALNDVSITERDPSRPFVYEFKVDGENSEIQRSSGVLVSSGTGSTAWMSSAAAIHYDQVLSIMKEFPIKLSVSDAKSLCDRVNGEIPFSGDSCDLQYLVREPLASVAAKFKYRRGFCTKISIRSLGWDSIMAFDGIKNLPLEKGTQAEIEIGWEPMSKLVVMQIAGPGEPFSRQ